MSKYVLKSPKNMAKLEKVLAVVKEMKRTCLKQTFQIRWLWFEGYVQSVIDHFPGLFFFEDNSAKPLVMHKPITCYKFLTSSLFG